MKPNFRDAPFGGAGLGRLLAAALLASFVWSAPNAFAEFTNVEVKVDGLACPLCAFGLEKKLAQVNGVTEVKTGMKSGTVNLTIGKGAGISVTNLREAVRKAGFTMGPVTVTAVGALKAENDRLILSVRDTRQEFLLFEDTNRGKEVHSGQQSKLLTEATESALRKLKQDGTMVAVTGQVHDHAEEPVGLLIERYEVVK